MAKASLTLISTARTPERQKLADAILERDRRAALVQAKSVEKADLTRQYEPIRSRQFSLEDDLKFTRQRTSSDTERLHALLSGESLPEVTSVEAMRAELEAVTAEVERLRQQQVVIDSDLRLLENAHSMALGWVQDAAAAVVAVEPATAAVVAEYAKVKTQLRMLDRAIDGALTVWLPGQAKTMTDHHVARGFGPLPPCPWQAARDCLASDPDARHPMPEDVFAEPSRPAA
jgi:chromosome segregation ATPase